MDAVNPSGATTDSAALSDADAVVALLTRVLGAPVSRQTSEGQYGFVTTNWNGLRVSVRKDSTKARVSYLAQSVGGIALRTAIGVPVGMSRAEAIAAGAEPVGASFTDQAGATIEILASGRQEAPGTDSNVNPGQVGSVYVEYLVTDGTVTQVIAPGDDFSDL